MSGGIIGEEWKGKADVFVDRLIVMGVGHYIVIIAGVIAVCIFYRKDEQLPETRTSSYLFFFWKRNVLTVDKFIG
ncbi:hypothetical protein Ngar_c35430 [Candidatus Nitrososphaera gargensis Ga9.2]|uniref:Uncharacterized protein n=1 Tax=Nitrososphaera gargensis (strain Ga9.2) TaxID=1237085 RepID=K0IGC7_NITGG|nr:hypothetical protein [Candidatus Nitrososphaera gargensis]AFU60456.1 hypothetical protein Ngar_c35430 [Candidatus Nitrososphaera gargensis Ga9.2]